MNSCLFLSTFKWKNHILVDVKLNNQIDLVTFKGKLASLLFNTIKKIIANNQIINIRFTVNDINRDEAIYEPRVDILKGKMVQKIPQHVQNVLRVPLPRLRLDHIKLNS